VNYRELLTHVTQKVIRPSPLAPLPKRERGTRKIQNDLLLPFSRSGRRGWGMRADLRSA